MIIGFSMPNYVGYEARHGEGLWINFDHLGILNKRRNLEHTGIFAFFPY